jgi:hypothetical protein
MVRIRLIIAAKGPPGKPLELLAETGQDGSSREVRLSPFIGRSYPAMAPFAPAYRTPRCRRGTKSARGVTLVGRRLGALDRTADGTGLDAGNYDQVDGKLRIANPC